MCEEIQMYVRKCKIKYQSNISLWENSTNTQKYFLKIVAENQLRFMIVSKPKED